jgi:hypothetical protein
MGCRDELVAQKIVSGLKIVEDVLTVPAVSIRFVDLIDFFSHLRSLAQKNAAPTNFSVASLVLKS